MARVMHWHDAGLTLASSFSGSRTAATFNMLVKFINTRLGINNAHCYGLKWGEGRGNGHIAGQLK